MLIHEIIESNRNIVKGAITIRWYGGMRIAAFILIDRTICKLN